MKTAKNKSSNILILSIILLVGGSFLAKKMMVGNEPIIEFENNNYNEEGVELEEVLEMLSFTLKDINGKEVSLMDYKNKKNIILSFWATWCTNCLDDFPTKLEYEKIYKEDVVFLYINENENVETINSYLEKHKFELENLLLDYDGKVARSYEIPGIPTSIFISKDFEKINGLVGTVSEEAFKKVIEDTFSL